MVMMVNNGDNDANGDGLGHGDNIGITESAPLSIKICVIFLSISQNIKDDNCDGNGDDDGDTGEDDDNGEYGDTG